MDFAKMLHRRDTHLRRMRARAPPAVVFAPGDEDDDSVFPTAVTAVVPNNPVTPTIPARPGPPGTPGPRPGSSTEDGSTTPAAQSTTTASSSSSTSTTATSANETTATTSTSTNTSATRPPSPASGATQPAAPTQVNTQTTIRSVPAVTTTRTGAGSGTASVASSTATSTTTSGMSTSGIVGVTAASIIGVAVLTAFVMFILRRCRKRRDDDFDPSIRRQSVMLPDESPSPLYRQNSDGRGPRPPSMIERHYAGFARPQPAVPVNPPMGHPYGQPYGAANGFSGSNMQQDRSREMGSAYPTGPSFEPGQIVSPVSPPPLMISGGAQAVFYNPMGQSPVGSPTSVAPYLSAYDENGQLVRRPSANAGVATSMGAGVAVSRSLSNSAGVALSRNPSNGAVSALSRKNSNGAHVVMGTAYGGEEYEGEYTTLARESVTPFQAAQYAEISRHLNISPPEPEPQSAGLSPFDDPRDSSTAHMLSKPSRPSSEFMSTDRVMSGPPLLPEMHLSTRESGAIGQDTFPVSPAPSQTSFSIAPLAVVGTSNVRPSPLAQEVTVSKDSTSEVVQLSPRAATPQRGQMVTVTTTEHDGRETPVEFGFAEHSSTVVTSTTTVVEKRTSTVVSSSSAVKTTSASKTSAGKRPETMYDDEDAYGGI